MNDNYSQPLSLTSQFRFCGNPFRLDFYHFCVFGCKYCFARNINGKDDFKIGYAKFEIVEKFFKKAFESNEEEKNIVIELLRHKVPIHVGGLADPFQPIEWQLKLNYKLIQLSNKYQYPLIFSTKQCYLPDEYYEILNPKLHAFQISLIGADDDYIRKYETNTPSATDRIRFLKTLREKGFWCSIRIQPVIDMNQVLKLCEQIDGIASYVTVEHLKIIIEMPNYKELFKDIIGNYKSRGNKVRELVLDTKEKEENIKRIKEKLPNTIVGVGDNDLHFLSQSRCCCGIDTIGEAFNNWLKYNLTYFTTEHIDGSDSSKENYYIPKKSVSNSLNSDIRIKNIGYKEYVDAYCGKFNNYMCDGCSMKNKLDGISFNKKTGKKQQQMSIFSMLEEDFKSEK